MGLPSFSERVLLNEERLTEFEEAFCRFVLSEPATASGETISSLAKRFYVSPNSIMRLARKLGYDGFSDMRYSLAHEVRSSDRTGHSLIGEEAISDESAAKLIDERVHRTIAHCCAERRLRRAVRLMVAADEIVFFGVGETAHVAHAVAQAIGGVDGKTSFVTYENQLRREIGRADGLLLLLASLSGETPQVVNLAREAIEAKVPLVTMTDLSDNTLASMATVSLYCCSPQFNIGGANLTDLTPLLAALTALERSYLAAIGVIPDTGAAGAGR